MAITYRVVTATTSLTTAQLNTLGEDDWRLLEVVQDNIGYRYIFFADV